MYLVRARVRWFNIKTSMFIDDLETKTLIFVGNSLKLTNDTNKIVMKT